MKPKKAAIVGNGKAGNRRASTLADLEIPLEWVVDKNLGRAKELSAKLHVPNASSDYRDVDNVDLVCICTSTDQHLQPVLHFCEKGVHVFVEKPFCESLAAGCEFMAKMGSCPKVAVGMNYTYRPPVEAGVSLALEGTIGRIVGIDAHIGHSQFQGCDDERSRAFLRAAGGPLLDLGVHVADLARQLVGDFSLVNAVTGTGGNLPASTNDSAVALFRKEDDPVLFQLSTSYVSFGNTHLRAEIRGTAGRMTISLEPDLLEVIGVRQVLKFEDFHDVSEYRRVPLCDGRTRHLFHFKSSQRHWKQDIQDFVDRLAGGSGSSYPTVAEALAAQNMIEAAETSARGGGMPVRISALQLPK